MSVVLNSLAKYQKRAAAVKPTDGSNDLPIGNYVGVITKGAITDAKDSPAKFVNFNVKVTEGELKGKPGRVSQNIVKKNDDLNEMGVGIVKGIFAEMFGKDDARVDNITEWEKLCKLSVGYRLKFRVYQQKDSEQLNTRVNAVLEPDQASEKADELEKADEEPEDEIPGLEKPKAKKKAAAKAAPVKEIEVEAEEVEEAEEEEETEESEGHSEDEVRKQLLAMDRSELKKFIVDSGLKEKVVVFKKDTEADIIEKIIAAAK